MSRLIEYPLPPNPPPHPQNSMLQFLTTTATNDFVYYTKYLTDIVGELNPAPVSRNVREWTIPLALRGHGGLAEPQGITHDEAGRIWVACERGNRLMMLDPRSGVFTAYFGGTATRQFIPSPRDLQFDGSGALWFTGATNATGATLGRLEISHRIVHLWTLPMDLLSPEGLAVEASGKKVWCSPINSNDGMTGAAFACLDLASGTVEMWHLGSWFRPVCAGIALDRTANPSSVWFAQDGAGSSPRVYRYDIGKRICYEYFSALTTAPRKIVTDASGNAWVTDWAGRVSFLDASTNCGQVSLTSSTVHVAPRTERVESKELRSQPVSWTSVAVRAGITAQQSHCVLDYPIPGVDPIPNGIALSPTGSNKRRIFFTEAGRNQIGELQP